MSINIKDYFIADSLPESLKDRNIKNFANLSDEFLHKVDNLIEKVLIYPRIDELDEEVINHLGYQQHIENFSTTLDIDSKHELIKNSFLLHRYKGTPWAVETTLSLMLAPTEILEWFNYGGEPYFFKPIIDLTDARISLDKKQKEELYRIINATKNVRSWLDYIIFVINFQEEVESSEELSNLQISLNYEDIIPYGTNHPLLRSKNLIRTGSLKRSPQLFRGNYKRGFQPLIPFRKPFENLNIDEIAFNLNLNFEDNLVDYIRRGGAIQHSQNLLRGTVYNAPLDLRLNSKICINYEDSVNVQDRDSKIMVMQTPKRGQLVRGSNLFRGSKFFGNDVEILKPPKRGNLSRGTFFRRSYTIVR